MTTPTTKRKRVAKPQQERHKDILDAAVEVFVAKGIAEARVEDITERAGVSKGTFYLYFKTKDEAAAAAWERHMNGFADAGEVLLGDNGNPIGTRLVNAMEELCRFSLGHAEVHRALYDAAGAEQVKAATNERLIQMIGAAIRSGVESGDLRCARPEMTARALYHGFCGAVTDAITGFVEIDHDEIIQAAGEMTRATLNFSERVHARGGAAR